ncbi:carbohydrate kinase [Verminephrobacter eiseniae]|uniref:FGGY-family carbohydrate kinase n=1 Tax=Verminephrobacter eiseniae TaxID=364317 RepID=UPI002238A29C|nr:FGGY-family carbohydrate kinase [Verminephrobacter eiseniae]MCW5263567.1 carbohydrate kinase [Verminephrobacter eiseniae]
MHQDLIIGIDAGTSVIKAVAFDLAGRQIAAASTPNQVLFGAHGAAEQDMERTWHDTAATLQALAQRLPNLAARTVALAATAQGDGTWLIDAAGQPVGPAMLWLDARAASAIGALRASPAAESITQRTGAALVPSMQSGQLLWLRSHQPERLAQASTALHCKDWLYFKATGERSTCHAESVFTFGNYHSGAYDDEVLALLGLSSLKRLLPPIVEPGQARAPLLRAAAQATGLREGTPVVLAPMDVPATLLGGGGVAYGPAGLRRVGCSVLGSTGMHGWASEGTQGLRPNAQSGYIMLMPLPAVRMQLMSHMAATLNIDWLLGLLAQAVELAGGVAPPGARLLERLDAAVLAAAPGQAIYHPYVAESGERGPFVDVTARAQLSGFSAGLGLPGLARAVFEGIALAARDCYAALGGPLPEEIRLLGGAARSPALRQLLASVTGRPVRVSQRQECGAAGAAMVAGVAMGHYASLRAALPDWTESCLDEHCTMPDPAEVALYDELFALYRQAAASNRPIWAALGALRSRAWSASPNKESIA